MRSEWRRQNEYRLGRWSQVTDHKAILDDQSYALILKPLGRKSTSKLSMSDLIQRSTHWIRILSQAQAWSVYERPEGKYDNLRDFNGQTNLALGVCSELGRGPPRSAAVEFSWLVETGLGARCWISYDGPRIPTSSRCQLKGPDQNFLLINFCIIPDLTDVGFTSEFLSQGETMPVHKPAGVSCFFEKPIAATNLKGL